MEQRKAYYDAMRILAMCLVIFNHLPGYELYASSSGIMQWIYLAATMITRINVPLFFMISGALLLGKEESWKTIFTKRVLRIIGIIVVFGIGLYFVKWGMAVSLHQDFDFSLKTMILGLVSGDGVGAYWYLYAYLGMLLTLPFLRSIALRMTGADFCVLLLLHFIMASLVPAVGTVFSAVSGETLLLSDSFHIPLATIRAMFYPLMGYYLDKKVDIKIFDAKKITMLVLMTVGGILISSGFTYYQGVSTGVYTQDYVMMFDYLTTICVFILVKLLFERSEGLSAGKFGNAVCKIGTLTLGIYLLDPYFKLVFFNSFNSFAEPLLPTFFVSVLWCFVSAVLGGAVTCILRKLPVMKKLL